MKKTSVLIPQSAKILNQKQMSSISGGNSPCPEGMIYINFPAGCVYPPGKIFNCQCTNEANPPFVSSWHAQYEDIPAMMEDIKQKCINGAGKCS